MLAFNTSACANRKELENLLRRLCPRAASGNFDDVDYFEVLALDRQDAIQRAAVLGYRYMSAQEREENPWRFTRKDVRRLVHYFLTPEAA